MSSSAQRAFSQRPVLVVALGGNALAPPIAGVDHYQRERDIVAQTGAAMAQLASSRYRLVIVHGNGPQVGRLLQSDPDPDPNRSNLDIHVAQTQGELGYLLMAAINAPTACLLTRVVVEPELGPPVKPIGPILDSAPAAPAQATQVAGGWRIVVPSPQPVSIVELDAISELLQTHHVIAGGGGGVPLSASGEAVSAVVDKDWVASLLAVELGAEHVIFATDVDGVYANFGTRNAKHLDRLSTSQARRLLQNDQLAAGSMAPKVASASQFATATGRTAHICALRDIQTTLAGASGTVVA